MTLSTVLIFVTIIFILGTLFWSFSTVLIERWKYGKSGIVAGRSECPLCHHTLSAWELIPLFSYIFQWGKCRGCKKHISFWYPLTEVFFWIIFLVMSYISISMHNELISIATLILLILWFITGVYMLYDIRYTEIPDQILVPWIVWYSILIILWYYLSPVRSYLFWINTYQSYSAFMIDHFRWAVLIYWFFYLQILIPGWWHLLRKWNIRAFIELLLSFFVFPFELILSMFFKKKDTPWESGEDIPAWIGWGDLRVALFIGLTLWTIHTLSTLFFAYITGSIVWVALIIQKRKWWNSHIAFGPFLWIGWMISMLLYISILSFISL